MTLRELCRQNSCLLEEDILLLEQYENTLPALSDLVSGDMFIDCMGQDGTAFVAAHARPKCIPSTYNKQVLGLPADRENEPAVYRAFQEGLPFHDTIASTQENRTVLQDVTPLYNKDRIIAVLISEHDISRQMQIEKKYRAISDTLLNESMKDSESPATFSVRESNHRIKNNLQLLSSVCSIKARNASSEGERNAYSESAAMVLSVAQLHSFFTDISNAKHSLDLKLLLEKLTAGLCENVLKDSRTAVLLDCDSVPVDPDTAVSVILCINELILNALKHAFPEGGGAIKVQVRSGNSYCSVLVADDGCGSDSISMGTGLQILSDTVRSKLGGELNLTSGPEGTKAAFTFPLL